MHFLGRNVALNWCYYRYQKCLPNETCSLNLTIRRRANADNVSFVISPQRNLNSNHNYIKILESDWWSAGLIWAVIVQLPASCLCNWTVRAIKLALVALEWVLFQHLAQKLNKSTCQIVYTTVIFFSNFVSYDQYRARPILKLLARLLPELYSTRSNY